MMVSSIHRGAHQVSRAGIDPDIFLIYMLLVDRACHKAAVRTEHEASHLGKYSDVAESCGPQYPVIDLFHAIADVENVVRPLVGTVGYAHAAGKVDEAHIRAGLLLDPDHESKKLL